MRYRILANRSRLVAQAFAKGVLSAFGHNPRLAARKIAGDVQFDPAAPNDSAVRMIARADSLAVMDDISEKDRREIERATREEVLESDRFPEIVFHSVSLVTHQTPEGRYRARIVGDLSLHGVVRKCVVEATVTLAGDTLRARGGVALRQSDFNIRLVSVAGGMLKLKDEVELSFEMVAERDE